MNCGRRLTTFFCRHSYFWATLKNFLWGLLRHCYFYHMNFYFETLFTSNCKKIKVTFGIMYLLTFHLVTKYFEFKNRKPPFFGEITNNVVWVLYQNVNSTEKSHKNYGDELSQMSKSIRIGKMHTTWRESITHKRFFPTHSATGWSICGTKE